MPGAPERLGVQREVLDTDAGGDQRAGLLLGATEVAHPQERTHHQSRGLRLELGIVLPGPDEGLDRLAVLGVGKQLRAAGEFRLRGQRSSGLGNHRGHGDGRGRNRHPAEQAGSGACTESRRDGTSSPAWTGQPGRISSRLDSVRRRLVPASGTGPTSGNARRSSRYTPSTGQALHPSRRSPPRGTPGRRRRNRCTRPDG